MKLEARLRDLLARGSFDLPLPGHGKTAIRHRCLAAIGREDLSLARLAEAHIDAVAILAEAGSTPEPGAIYGVWASETPNQPLQLERLESGFALTGAKLFCSGAGLVDRALVTVTLPERCLVDIGLRENSSAVLFDWSDWATCAFSATRTATASFVQAKVAEKDMVGGAEWYLKRAGFWHGACGPASCWAGGAIGLVDYALKQARNDPHTLAHLGAMTASAWAMWSYLDSAGEEIDANPADTDAACRLALTLRHLVDQACTDVLQRFARSYGPRALAFDAETSRRCQELQLYIRQSHAERDLELLGKRAHESALTSC
jgi:hypothetical protein